MNFLRMDEIFAWIPGFTLPMCVAMMIENEGVSQCSKVSKMRLSVFHQKLLSVHRAFNNFQPQSFLRPFTATVWCRLRMCSAAEKLAWRRGGKLITSCLTLEMWRKRSLKFFHRLFHVKLSRKAFSSFLVESERVVWGEQERQLVRLIRDMVNHQWA